MIVETKESKTGKEIIERLLRGEGFTVDSKTSTTTFVLSEGRTIVSQTKPKEEGLRKEYNLNMKGYRNDLYHHIFRLRKEGEFVEIK